jgi:hypothetical protein
MTRTPEEYEAQLDRIEAALAKMAQRPAVNPLDAIGKLMESELVQGVQDKAAAFEEYVRQALKDIYKAVDRCEQKINLHASQST